MASKSHRTKMHSQEQWVKTPQKRANTRLFTVTEHRLNQRDIDFCMPPERVLTAILSVFISGLNREIQV